MRVGVVVGRTAPILRRDEQRFRVIQAIGCLPCLMVGDAGVPATIQHVSRGYKRVGGAGQHQQTYGSCTWHHLGYAPKRRGPSLADGRRPFEMYFAPEEDLIRLQDDLIEIYLRDPWMDLEVPYSAVAPVIRAGYRRILEATEPGS